MKKILLGLLLVTSLTFANGSAYQQMSKFRDKEFYSEYITTEIKNTEKEIDKMERLIKENVGKRNQVYMIDFKKELEKKLETLESIEVKKN